MTDTTTGSATGTARDQAAGVASDARDAGHRVASTAKSEATNVAHEATSQAKQLFEQTGGELREQAAQQQSRAASGLRTVGEQLRSMAQNTDQGVASDVVNQVANRVSSTAEWLDARDPGSLLDEVTSFARRRPGAFIAIAAGAGILAGRLVKSLAAGANESSTPQFQSGTVATPATTTAAFDTGTGVGYAGGTVGTPTYDAVLADSPIDEPVPGSFNDGRP